MFNETRRGNTIAIWGIIVSALAFTATIVTLVYVRASTVAAIAAVNESKRANDHTVYKDSISHISDSLQSIKQNYKDSLSYIKDSNTIALAKQSLQAQINSINESQREFNIQNRPLLKISDLIINDTTIGKPIIISYNISNVGIKPAKIITIKFTYDLTFIEKPKYVNFDSKNVKSYIPNGQHIPITQTINNQKWNKALIETFIKSQFFIYIYGEVTYINSLTNKPSVYRYEYKITSIPNDVTAVHDDDDYKGQSIFNALH